MTVSFSTLHPDTDNIMPPPLLLMTPFLFQPPLTSRPAATLTGGATPPSAPRRKTKKRGNRWKSPQSSVSGKEPTALQFVSGFGWKTSTPGRTRALDPHACDLTPLAANVFLAMEPQPLRLRGWKFQSALYHFPYHYSTHIHSSPPP